MYRQHTAKFSIHDKLMSHLITRIYTKRVMRLIRRCLTAGVMIDGLVSATDRGMLQGRPLSSLLFNIVLDQLDKDLQRRELRFVRYAEDCVIDVRSKRLGERVMQFMSHSINRKLRLKVNPEISTVSRPGWHALLSFTICRDNQCIRIYSLPFKRLQTFHDILLPATYAALSPFISIFSRSTRRSYSDRLCFLSQSI